MSFGRKLGVEDLKPGEAAGAEPDLDVEGMGAFVGGGDVIVVWPWLLPLRTCTPFLFILPHSLMFGGNFLDDGGGDSTLMFLSHKTVS